MEKVDFSLISSAKLKRNSELTLKFYDYIQFYDPLTDDVEDVSKNVYRSNINFMV